MRLDMEIEIKFNELKDFLPLKKEVSSLFTESFAVVDFFVKRNKWIYATLNDKQIIGNDAVNLSRALKDIGCDAIYVAWAYNFFKEDDDFFVKKILSNSFSIEEIQKPESEIDHLESFFFSEYPLKFLMFRPDTNQQLLYILGSADFVNYVAKEDGWEIFDLLF